VNSAPASIILAAAQPTVLALTVEASSSNSGVGEAGRLDRGPGSGGGVMGAELQDNRQGDARLWASILLALFIIQAAAGFLFESPSSSLKPFAHGPSLRN
jgi:hypothetical protein